EPAQLERWYAPGCPWAIPELHVGATVRFYHTDTEVLLATIEVVAPLRRLTLRWQPDQVYPATTLVTTFLLAEENGGTRITIIEAGYESLPEDVRQHRLDETAEGYSGSLEQLKAYLECTS
ncbi:MAG TPA: SRPBCC domain-containing protein, partial [Roseiflexaceae bacterium]|nr:SRPBCC domain-containing protein [Roseiflexaceae bacterium]